MCDGLFGKLKNRGPGGLTTRTSQQGQTLGYGDRIITEPGWSGSWDRVLRNDRGKFLMSTAGGIKADGLECAASGV